MIRITIKIKDQGGNVQKKAIAVCKVEMKVKTIAWVVVVTVIFQAM